VCVKKYERLVHVLIVQLFWLVVNRFLPLLANQRSWFLLVFELFLNIVIDKTTLNHRNQIAMIVWTDESNWASTPAGSQYEVIVVGTMSLVIRIEHYEWTTK
jgi:hypothetical protein